MAKHHHHHIFWRGRRRGLFGGLFAFPLIIIMLIVVGIFLFLVPHSTHEGYFYNQFNTCLAKPPKDSNEDSYPGWWVKVYGNPTNGSACYPYARPNNVLADQPTKCGGCWGGFTQY